MQYAVGLIIGYLLGSIPVALLVGRAHGVDLREVGDRNPGAWNALEQLGARAAAPVFAGDAAKGLAAGLVGLGLGDVAVAYVSIAGAMAGHAFPLLASFRGGKSVMTFVSGAFAVSPLAAGAALACCVAVSLASSFRWGARIGVFGFPLLQLAFDPAIEVAATGGLMGLIGLRYLGRLSGRSAPASSAPGAASRG